MDLPARVQRWWQRSTRCAPWLLDGLIGTTFVIGGLLSHWGGQPNAAIDSKTERCGEHRADLRDLDSILLPPPGPARRARRVDGGPGHAGRARTTTRPSCRRYLLVGAYTVGSWCPARRVVLAYAGLPGCARRRVPQRPARVHRRGAGLEHGLLHRRVRPRLERAVPPGPAGRARAASRCPRAGARRGGPPGRGRRAPADRPGAARRRGPLDGSHRGAGRRGPARDRHGPGGGEAIPRGHLHDEPLDPHRDATPARRAPRGR